MPSAVIFSSSELDISTGSTCDMRFRKVRGTLDELEKITLLCSVNSAGGVYKLQFGSKIKTAERCKKQTVVANSTTKAEYVAASRLGKDFPVESQHPLIPPWWVTNNQEERGEGSSMPTERSHTYIIQPSTSQPKKTQKPKRPKRKDTKVYLEARIMYPDNQLKQAGQWKTVDKTQSKETPMKLFQVLVPRNHEDTN
ncbi:hypothetical protein Tco_0158281 [Tanacetum coccineum]